MSTQFLDRAGGLIAFDDSGSGPLVVCVPGMGDLRQEYRFLVERLVRERYRVVTMDVRGHGESSAAWSDFSVAAIGSDIVALIGHLGAGPAVVVGTSMAAGAGVCAAAEAPSDVAGLVLVGPFVRNVSASPLMDILAPVLFPVLFADPWGASSWARYFTSLFPTKRPPDFEEYVRRLRQNLSERGRLAALRGMLAASKAASESRLGQVKAPVLVVMGTKDPDFRTPAGEARLVAERLYGTVTMIEGAGHYPYAEMPDETIPAIVSFVRSVSPSETPADSSSAA